MMPSLLNSHHPMGGVSHHQMYQGYPVDTMLVNELSRQLAANTKRYSREMSSQQRAGNAMRISKPGSANNSPRSSTMQARRRTLIGDGFQPRFHPQQQYAAETAYRSTPTSETPSEQYYEPEVKRARPVSWHPSPQHYAPAPLYQSNNNTPMLCPYPSHSEAEILASLHHLPPTPAIYSGYTSPAESFSPLSLPYSGFNSQEQPVYSPQAQVQATQQQQQQHHQSQAPIFRPVPGANYGPSGTVSEVSYSTTAALPSLTSWDSYSAATNTAPLMVSQHTAPPTPEDFACTLSLKNHSITTPIKMAEMSVQAVQVQEDETEEEGEILYGMGLYDPPAQSATTVQDLHRPTIFSLLGGPPCSTESNNKEGLGLKLEEEWEPTASDAEEEEEEDEDEDGECEGDDE